MMVWAPLFFLVTASADRGPWTKRSISHFIRLRTGASGTIWRARGTLSNTLNGAHIAEVEALERSYGSKEENGFVTQRVVVYRDANGTRLAAPLKYEHKISAELHDGRLLLQAMSDEAVVASGWGVGRGPTRRGPLCRVYELSIRPVKGDGARSEEPPDSASPPGWPRTANRGALRSTREEYKLLAPSRPGGPCCLSYKRTGACPHWYGGGVCTLELEATTAPKDAWWRRGRLALRALRGRGASSIVDSGSKEMEGPTASEKREAQWKSEVAVLVATGRDG